MPLVILDSSDEESKSETMASTKQQQQQETIELLESSDEEEPPMWRPSSKVLEANKDTKASSLSTRNKLETELPETKGHKRRRSNNFTTDKSKTSDAGAQPSPPKKERTLSTTKKRQPPPSSRDFFDSDTDDELVVKSLAVRSTKQQPNDASAAADCGVGLLSTPNKACPTTEKRSTPLTKMPPMTRNATARPTEDDTDTAPVLDNTAPVLDNTAPILDISGECWGCGVPLELPEPQICWYQRHEHIHLKVPSCCVCNETILNQETESTIDHDNTYCAGCGDDQAETYLLCDSCPLVFCFDCVAKAHNDCTTDVEAMANDSQSEWNCLVCAPTKRVVALQNLAPVSRSKDELLDQLFTAEEEKKRCEAMPVKDDDSAQILKERRLDDFIACCLDELQQLHGLTPALVYNMYHDPESTEQFLSRREQDSDDEDSENVPEYVKAANKVIRNRNKEDKKELSCVVAKPNDHRYKEAFVDVEDLGSDGEAVPARDCWRSRISQPVQQCQVREARANESRKRFSVTRKTDAEDKSIEQMVVQSKREFSVRSNFQNQNGISTNAKIKAAKKVSGQLNGRRVADPATTPYKAAISSPASTLSPFTGTVDLAQSELSDELSPRKKLRMEHDLSRQETDGSHSGEGLVLCSTSDGSSRSVSVLPELTILLKNHQTDGIQFMWRNSFIDFAKREEPGGCILAHAMGLGKSLSTIALIHTVMTNSALYSREKQRFLVHRVALVCPVNTIANWEREFHKWQRKLKRSVTVTNLSTFESSYRPACIKNHWYEKGGILLLSDKTLVQICKNNPSAEARLQKADLLVCDEAHTMLCNPRNVTYKTLQKFETRRRIGLTGSPFQNNLVEYFHLISFVRPDAFQSIDEKTFRSLYEAPINKGMAKDATIDDALLSLSKSQELNEKLSSYLHRVDASVLQNEIGTLHHYVLHVQQTRVQSRLFASFKKKQKTMPSLRNFFAQVKKLQPIINHPGALLSSTIELSGDEWWTGVVNRIGESKVKKVDMGYKIVILLHILIEASKMDDKVLIFCNCLSTLNYIEQVLAMANWGSHVASLAEQFPGEQLGGWRKDVDFLRIDGTDSASERGVRVSHFEKKESRAKAFLLSKAGGIGINLVAANRVVLFDGHFNPTIASQAVCRSYRIGQQKEVFVYRLLLKGTIEEKVYGRCVNKTGVALRVIDQKSIERSFTASEVADLSKTIVWVQCEDCEKWRVLPGLTEEELLPERWTCSMNADTDNNSCDCPERNQIWYERKWAGLTEVEHSPLEIASELEAPNAKAGDEDFTDSILQHLVSLKTKKSTVIDKHYSHQDLLKTSSSSSEMVKVEQNLLKWHEQQKQQVETAAKHASETQVVGSVPIPSSTDDSKVKVANNVVACGDAQTRSPSLVASQEETSGSSPPRNTGDDLTGSIDSKPAAINAKPTSKTAPSIDEVQDTNSDGEPKSHCEPIDDGANTRENHEPCKPEVLVIDLCSSGEE